MSPLRVALLLVLVSAPARLVAQQQSLAPHYASAVWDAGATRTSSPVSGLLGSGDRDYRYTGFYIGAGYGLAAMLFSAAYCSDPDNSCTTGHALLVGPPLVAVAGVAGAVIGSLFKKTPPRSADAEPAP